jgi:uncharacterized protein
MNKLFRAKIIPLQNAYELSFKLALLIIKSGYTFDAAIAIARGGFPMARFICDFLNIRHLGSIQITHYAAGASQNKTAEIVASANIEVKNKRILVLDDVNDTGKTILAAREYLNTLHPLMFKIAVIHEKQNTIAQADFVGEYLMEWKWLIYQWAVTEDILGFLKKDNMLTVNADDARLHLKTKYHLSIDKDTLDNILQLKHLYYPE